MAPSPGASTGHGTRGSRASQTPVGLGPRTHPEISLPVEIPDFTNKRPKQTLKKSRLRTSHGLGTWGVHTEESCLSTRGPRNLVLIWPSLAVTAAIGMLAHAQRARAETCTRTRPRSCTQPGSGGIATAPTAHPERGNRAGYIHEHGGMRACTGKISEEIAS